MIFTLQDSEASTANCILTRGAIFNINSVLNQAVANNPK